MRKVRDVARGSHVKGAWMWPQLLSCKWGIKGHFRAAVGLPAGTTPRPPETCACQPALLDGVPAQQVVQHRLHGLTDVLDQQRVSLRNCLLDGVQVAAAGQGGGLVVSLGKCPPARPCSTPWPPLLSGASALMGVQSL